MRNSGHADLDLDIIVVANGCTDDTAAIAAAYGYPVRVVEIGVASKQEALKAGDEAAKGFPRVYLDADVELDAAGLSSLARALDTPGVLAAVPERDLDLARSPWPVRWYYDIWSRLPAVRHGLFGRGAIAVSEAGHERIAALPPLLADDLAFSLAFGRGERLVVPEARVLIHAPRVLADLIRRRVRVVTGVNQIERSARGPGAPARASGAPARAPGAPARGPGASERTSIADLLTIFASNPALAPKLAVFLAVTAVARRNCATAARKSDYISWPRDESSRV